MAYLLLELRASNGIESSVITANLYICDTKGGWNHWSPSGAITIDGTSYSFSHSFDQYQSQQWIGAAQQTVSYGSGSSRTVSVSAYFDSNVSFGRLTTSKSITINRTYQGASAVSIAINGKPATTGSVCVLGQDTITLTIRKNNSDLKYGKRVTLAGTRFTYGDFSNSTGTETWDFIPDLQFFGERMPTVAETDFAVGVLSQTASGSDVSYDYWTLKLRVPEYVKPTLSSHSVDVYSDGLSGYLLQNKSTAAGSWTFGDNNLYGAKIDRLIFKHDGLVHNITRSNYPSEFPPSKSSGEQTFKVPETGTKSYSMTVYDTRGRSSTYSGTYTVYAYTPPVLSHISADRCTSSGTTSGSGTYAKVGYSGSISSVAGANSGTLTIKLVDGSSTTTKATVSVSSGSPSIDSSSIISGISAAKAYVVVVELTDTTGTTARLTTAVQKAGVIFDRCPTGLGLGTTAIPGYITFDELVRPTIGLHDYGPNGNGEWIRFGNGVQICWQVTVKTTSIPYPYGSLYVGSTSWTFPRSFSKTPAVSIGEAYWGTGASWGIAYNTTKTNCGIRLLDAVKRGDDATELSMIAIGRWR